MIVNIINGPIFIRSATAPETIVAAVAANIPWNRKSVHQVYPPLAYSGVIPFSGGVIPGTILPRYPLNSPGYIKLKPMI